MNFYELLGVSKDASIDIIKRAYKKKARGAHPDLGGNTDEMSEVNRAYACLKDPHRRLLYDQTGEDKPLPPLEAAIRDALLGALNVIIVQNIKHARLRSVRMSLKKQLSDMEAGQRNLLKAREDLTVHRDKISVQKGENLFHLLVDRQMQMFDGQLAHCEHQVSVLTGALALLENYSSLEDVAQEMLPTSSPSLWSYTQTTTGGIFG